MTEEEIEKFIEDTDDVRTLQVIATLYQRIIAKQRIIDRLMQELDMDGEFIN